MSKQDRVCPRTASDLERKYNFNETFAEAMGLAEDAKETALKAKEAADKATDSVDELDAEEIFNRLTNNGEDQGLYREDGKIYLNAEYLQSGEINADLIKTGTLNADLIKSGTLDASLLKTGVITSADGTVAIDLANNTVTIATNENGQEGSVVLSSSGVSLYGLDATVGEAKWFLRLSPGFVTSDGTVHASNVMAPYLKAPLHIQANGWVAVGSNNDELRLYGESVVINDKTVSWKDNGDGTFTLIGR